MDYELLFGKKRKTRRSPKRRSPKRKTSSKKLSKKMLNSCSLKCLRKLALRYKVSIPHASLVPPSMSLTPILNCPFTSK